jgi:hypothetical protein
MLQALWIAPSEALARNRKGSLPMVFPTMLTLQALEPFQTPADALKELGGREIPRLCPEVEEARDGVRMILKTVPPA